MAVEQHLLTRPLHADMLVRFRSGIMRARSWCRMLTQSPYRYLPAVVCAALAVSYALVSEAATLREQIRERVLERRGAARAEVSEAGQQIDAPRTPAALPAGVRVLRDQPYGKDARERFDVYLPELPVQGAPVIFMVHGGAWAYGDKAMPAVVEHKVARWVPRGFIVIATNYRMLPQAKALQQARGVASALATAQARAAEWGADRQRFVLMGHSAGAHLVALIASSPAISDGLSVTPWLGTVALDSAAFDVVQIMRSPRYPRFYDRAFGNEPAQWRLASPFHALKAAGAPLLAVCSSRRADSCPQAQGFVDKAVPLGMRASVLQEDLSHGDINRELGAESAYTDAVEAFIASLEPSLDRLIGAARPVGTER